MSLVEGKNCLITGATSGIGRSTALALSKMGANIFFIARNADKAEELREEIKEISGKSPHVIIGDLSSLKQIKKVAEEYKYLNEPIDILLNNAGIMNTERRVTEDGLEEVFAVNHLAYFLLTNLLIDEVLRSSVKRVVNVSSDAHRFLKSINFDDLQSEKEFKMFTVYGQSKLANILFTKKLSTLYQDRGLTTNCLHPGFVSTSIGTQNQNRPFLARLIKWVSPLIGKTSDKGAETSIYLCSSEEVSSISGEYFIDCKKAPITKAAESKEDAEKLWQISLELTGLN